MKHLLVLVSVALLLGTFAAEAQTPLAMGTPAPPISAMASDSAWVHLDSLLRTGPVVVVFYRGHWCPYCNRHLQALQDSLELLQAQGINLLAITPEMPNYIAKMREKTGAQFAVIWDENHRIMDAYNVSFQLTEGKHRTYSLAGININRFSGLEDRTLPVPATYLIGQDGTIKRAFFDTDYTHRVSVAEILSWVAELR